MVQSETSKPGSHATGRDYLPAMRCLPLVLLLPLAACERPAPEVSADDVTRVLATLAHDSMAGRRAFTPDADRAAAFLAAEFERIGLEPFPGAPGYRQAFTVSTMTPRSAYAELGGQSIPEDRIAPVLTTTAITWQEGDTVNLKVIGPADDFREGLSAVRRLGGNSLVLVHPAHAQWFARLRTMRSRTITGQTGANTVYLLTDQPVARAWRVQASVAVEEQPATNVVGMIPGRRDDEIVLFSAHYDHIGVQAAVDGDSIANGANDDASGVTGVVELARWFRAAGRPERTLVFVAFTAEESGGWGSRYFSQQLDPARIVAMFNLEMIGKPGATPSSAWITGYERTTFGFILTNAAPEGYRFAPDPYPAENLFYRSDNATLARLGVPAHSLSTTAIDVDPDYHQVSDEVRTLDIGHMVATIRAIALASRPIVSGRATPTRLDPETVN